MQRSDSARKTCRERYKMKKTRHKMISFRIFGIFHKHFPWRFLNCILNVCACVCEIHSQNTHTHIYIYINSYTYIYTHIHYLCMCTSVQNTHFLLKWGVIYFLLLHIYLQHDISVKHLVYKIKSYMKKIPLPQLRHCKHC